MIISTTDMQEAKKCFRKWWFNHIFCGGATPQRPVRSLVLGTGIHKGLEVFYSHPKKKLETRVTIAIQAFTDSVDLEYDYNDLERAEVIELGTNMLYAYSEFALRNDSFEVVSLEHPMELPIEHPLTHKVVGTLTGTADGIIKISNKYYVMEHKTARSFWRDTAYYQHTQTLHYLAMLQDTLKETSTSKVEGIMFNILRKKIPVEPKLLKNGTLSKARCDTTAEKYVQTLLKHGLDSKGYMKIIFDLGEQEKFIQRKWIYRTPNEIVGAKRQLYYDHKVIQNMEYPVKTSADHCNWCSYSMICKGIEEGHDVISMVKSLYKPSEREQGKGCRLWDTEAKSGRLNMFEGSE